MKKWSLSVILLFVLGMFTPASAMEQTGKFVLGGSFGYSFGIGNVFKKYEYPYTDQSGQIVGRWKSQNKASFSFEAKVKYGINPNIALAGALHYQAGKFEGEEASAGIERRPSVSESWHWIGILANGLYTVSPRAKTTPYFTGGVGWYIPDEGDSKPGINLGGGVEHFFQDNLALDAGARFHMIFTEGESTTYVNVYAGLNFYVRGK